MVKRRDGRPLKGRFGRGIDETNLAITHRVGNPHPNGNGFPDTVNVYAGSIQYAAEMLTRMGHPMPTTEDHQELLDAVVRVL